MAVRCINRLLLIAFLVFTTTGHAAQEQENVQKPNHEADIADLFYKNSLFHYYSGDYISALTKTLINDEQYKNETLNTKNKLLLGGIYLAYGLDYDAKAIFENLNNTVLDEEIKNIIWFYIGRDFYNNFDYVNSEASLENITDNISDKNKIDKINIISNVYVYNNSLQKIETLLNDSTLPPDVINYLKFNLAIGYLRNNENIKGTRYLTEVANMKPSSLEQTSLRDKAKLHLANLAFKKEDYKASIKHIDEMDSHGLFSESAIYLSALSHSISGNSKKAFSLLNALKARDSRNIYKYYSILLIARILEQNGSLDESLHVLNDGVNNIKSEKKELDALREKIRNNFFLTDLKMDKNGSVVVTNEEYKELVNELVFSREFSGLYNHYVDLLHLQKTIRHWNNQLPEFYVMLKERDRFFKEKKSQLSVKQYHTKRSQFLNRIRALESQLKATSNNGSVEGLYTETESEYAEDLESISKKVARLSRSEDMSDYTEKVRIMKGLNYWNAASQYHARLWQAQSELNQAVSETTLLDKRILSLQKALKSEFNYTKHKKNVDSLYSRLKIMDSRLNSAVVRLKEELVLIASSELDKRFKDIDSYYRVFKFDVARVSDRILINKNNDKN